jgi:hypothetical protein
MRTLISLFIAVISLISFPLHAGFPTYHKDVSVEIIADDGRVYPVHNLHASKKNNFRAYLEATHGDNYGIRVRNLTGKRLGLVIAVDGRNIISGQQSHLKNNERMYILEPYQQASYKGWRTTNQKINRFYFTHAGDSYAGAWKDYTAMGVIVLAVFPEKQPRYYRPYEKKSRSNAGRNQAYDRAVEAPAAAKAESDFADSKEMQPGTGYGQEQHSYARVVHFEPQSTPSSKTFYKYEWRQTLCQKDIITCYKEPENRFWPNYENNYGFAPPPPGLN